MLLCDKATNKLFNLSQLTIKFSILPITPPASSHFSQDYFYSGFKNRYVFNVYVYVMQCKCKVNVKLVVTGTTS